MRKKSFFKNVILGNTRTKQLSGASVRIATNKYLSERLYEAMDKNKSNFEIKDEKGKTYKVRQLIPANRK
ncbi:hypothetical protein [Tenacibaculum agarivorans]|uniref:hypothetical protein n=1 Tax=Tenacibaculum agarivorans TaxID=1908389 RepID=UPI00094BB5A5|nr:hypothetical protein [Tenacibaculum agarivorans]